MDSELEAKYREEVQEQLTQWEKEGETGEKIKAASKLLDAIQIFENLRK